MKIIFYPRDQDGPGCYRCLYPAAQLSEQGGHVAKLGAHTVVHEQEDFVAIRYDLNSRLIDADMVVIAMPTDKEWNQFQQELQAKGIKVVVELDDDYLNLPDWNPAKKATSAANVKIGKPSIVNLIWALRHADGVTVTTPALRDSVAKVTNAPIYVLRNFLDWRVWERRAPVYDDRSWKKLRIGYLGLAHWHSGDLQILNPWFGEWIAAHADVEFVTCDPSLHDLLGIPERQRVSTSSFAFRHQEVADFASVQDIGLVPLQRHQFNEAKSHLKGMEYAGAGVPCIATPTESYAEWWLSGDSAGPEGAGFLAEGRAEWISALDRLHADPDGRVRMARKARALAAENTYQKHWRLWEQAYSEILATGSPRSYTHRTGKRADALGVLV